MMACAKNRGRVAETHVAEEMHPPVAVAKLRPEAPVGGHEELEGRACTLREGREHPLNPSEQAPVRDVKNCHRRLVDTRSYLINGRLMTPRASVASEPAIGARRRRGAGERVSGSRRGRSPADKTRRTVAQRRWCRWVERGRSFSL